MPTAEDIEYESKVAQQEADEKAWRLDKARENVKARKAESALKTPPATSAILSDRYQRERTDIPWLVEDRARHGHNVIVPARYKAGKTTLFASLIACLADGDAFLGKHAVTPPEGRIAFWDYEMEDDDTDDYLREARVCKPDRVAVENLKGFYVPFATSDAAFRWAVEWHKVNETGVWVIDSLTKVAAQHGISQRSDEIGVILDAIDKIKEDAGIESVIVSCHIPHAVQEGEERAYGDQSISAWADVIWPLSRTNGSQDRFISSLGRRVPELEAEQVELRDGRVVLTGLGRDEAAAAEIDERVMAALLAPGRSENPLTRTQLYREVKGQEQRIRASVGRLQERGLVRVLQAGKSDLIISQSLTIPHNP